MANNQVHMPGSFGGLMRFQDEYASRINIKPAHVVAFVILIIAFRIGLSFLY